MIEQIQVEGFDKNFSYIIHDGVHAGIVDPTGNIDAVFRVLEEKKLTLDTVLITHSHGDHHDKLGAVLAQYPNISVHAHTGVFGHIHAPIANTVEEGSVVSIGDVQVRVLYTPGHTTDSVCYLVEDEQTLITGDTLFVEGAGRVSGENDAKVLYATLNRLKTLPDEIQILPGHDYGSKSTSTIEWEKKHNRFFLASNFLEFRKERLGH